MINFFNKRFLTKDFPPVIIHVYYFLLALTFCYIYYHKFLDNADFYSAESTGGIYAVAEFDALKPIQFRLLIPLLFTIIKSIISLPDKVLFFVIILVMTYFILIGFYYLLNQYLQNKNLNLWLSPVILYPLMWNLIILNGQFFYMDFSAFLIIILGYYFIVSEKFNLLVITFIIGITNHPSAGYLIPAFLLYRYRELLNLKTWIYTGIMSLMYLGYYLLMENIFADNKGYFVINNLSRNMKELTILPLHIILRDLILNFGGLHIFALLLLLSGIWKKYLSPMLMITLVIIPYIISVFLSFSIEEIRNYITIVPFITILALIYLSTVLNTNLKPAERLLAKNKNELINERKVLVQS